jgi:hypothetical protein
MEGVMAISRKWWEPEPQDIPRDMEWRARRSFDLGDLMGLAMSGGEFTSCHLDELLCCAGHEPHPSTHFISVRDAAARTQAIVL